MQDNQRPELPAAAASHAAAPPLQQQSLPGPLRPVAGPAAAAAPRAAAPDDPRPNDPRRWLAHAAPSAPQAAALPRHGGLGPPGDARELGPLLNAGGPLPPRAACIKVEEHSGGATGAAVPWPQGQQCGSGAAPADAVMSVMDAAWKPVLDADHGRRPSGGTVASWSRPSSPERNKCGWALLLQAVVKIVWEIRHSSCSCIWPTNKLCCTKVLSA